MPHSGRLWAPLALGAAALGAPLGCSSPDFDAWPARLVIQSRQTQIGLQGFAVNFPPAVRLLDADGEPVRDAKVAFNVTAGGGSVSGAVATTGIDGTATVGGWSIGAGGNRVSASLPAPFRVAPVSFTATGVAAAYNIDVVYLQPTTPARQAVFDAAATRWEELIFGDVADITVNIPDSLCFDDQPAINQTIDDVLIFVVLDSIDGPGKALGLAGPCFIRSTSKLPLNGVMIFDTADVTMLDGSGILDDVIVHEMAHVLGFGTLWGPFVLNLLVGGGSGSDPHFVGAQARAAFDRIGGTGYTLGAKVPVENTGGPGTRDSHWRESVFRNELMTGFIGLGANPLSIVTVAAMGDEAYDVNYGGADAFSSAFAAVVGVFGGAALAPIALGDDVLRLPIRTVDERGRVTGVYRW